MLEAAVKKVVENKVLSDKVRKGQKKFKQITPNIFFTKKKR